MSEDVQRSTGRRWRYKIGTTAVVEANSHRFLCVALTKTDLTTLKASADVCQFWDAMRGILRKCRTEANGDGMALPLIGSGLAGIGLPPMHLLQLMILAIIEESKQAKVCTEIRIVLPENRFDLIDLASIEHLWS
jgi:hypothetical protein